MVMGNAWFRMLPGVFDFAPDMDCEAIAASKIDHEALEAATGALVARGHAGVAVRGWEKVMDHFDTDQNIDNIARAALGLLRGEIPFSFAKP